MNCYSSSLPDWYALTSPKYKVISKASIAAGLAVIYKDRLILAINLMLQG